MGDGDEGGEGGGGEEVREGAGGREEGGASQAGGELFTKTSGRGSSR